VGNKTAREKVVATPVRSPRHLVNSHYAD